MKYNSKKVQSIVKTHSNTCNTTFSTSFCTFIERCFTAIGLKVRMLWCDAKPCNQTRCNAYFFCALITLPSKPL